MSFIADIVTQMRYNSVFICKGRMYAHSIYFGRIYANTLSVDGRVFTFCFILLLIMTVLNVSYKNVDQTIFDKQLHQKKGQSSELEVLEKPKENTHLPCPGPADLCQYVA